MVAFIDPVGAYPAEGNRLSQTAGPYVHIGLIPHAGRVPHLREQDFSNTC